MLASMAEREQLHTLSACKDTTFLRDYRRISQKIVNCQLTKYPFVSVCRSLSQPFGYKVTKNNTRNRIIFQNHFATSALFRIFATAIRKEYKDILLNSLTINTTMASIA